jgi:hypothetical protein
MNHAPTANNRIAPNEAWLGNRFDADRKDRIGAMVAYKRATLRSMPLRVGQGAIRPLRRAEDPLTPYCTGILTASLNLACANTRGSLSTIGRLSTSTKTKWQDTQSSPSPRSR